MDNLAYKNKHKLERFVALQKDKNHSEGYKREKEKEEEYYALKNAESYEEYHKYMIARINVSFLEMIQKTFKREMGRDFHRQGTILLNSPNKEKRKTTKRFMVATIAGDGNLTRKEAHELKDLSDEVKRINILPYTDHSNFEYFFLLIK